MKIKFKQNKIRYGQDHQFFMGVPAGVEWDIVSFTDSWYEMTACGYGCQNKRHGRCYGNGRIYPSKKDMDKRLKKRGIDTKEIPKKEEYWL